MLFKAALTSVSDAATPTVLARLSKTRSSISSLNEPCAIWSCWALVSLTALPASRLTRPTFTVMRSCTCCAVIGSPATVATTLSTLVCAKANVGAANATISMNGQSYLPYSLFSVTGHNVMSVRRSIMIKKSIEANEIQPTEMSNKLYDLLLPADKFSDLRIVFST